MLKKLEDELLSFEKSKLLQKKQEEREQREKEEREQAEQETKEREVREQEARDLEARAKKLLEEKEAKDRGEILKQRYKPFSDKLFLLIEKKQKADLGNAFTKIKIGFRENKERKVEEERARQNREREQVESVKREEAAVREKEREAEEKIEQETRDREAKLQEEQKQLQEFVYFLLGKNINNQKEKSIVLRELDNIISNDSSGMGNSLKVKDIVGKKDKNYSSEILMGLGALSLGSSFGLSFRKNSKGLAFFATAGLGLASLMRGGYAYIEKNRKLKIKDKIEKDYSDFKEIAISDLKTQIKNKFI